MYHRPSTTSSANTSANTSANSSANSDPQTSRAGHDLARPTRRDFVRVGSLPILGLGLVDLLRLAGRADEESGQRHARSCILIWLDGGPSHIDMFDPKPQAPVEVRGPFATIPTATPGVALSELLPETARIVDRIAILRSVTSPLGEHNFGTHYLLTGYKPTPALDYPSMGSVVAHQLAATGRRFDLPPLVAVPDFHVGGGKFSATGFLGSEVAPFQLHTDPSDRNYQIQNLQLPPSLNHARIQRRQDYRKQLDAFRQAVDAAGMRADDAFDRAHRLLTSSLAARAFDVAQEPQAVRNRYGPKSIGQCCLLARRLVERGVPFVTVNNRGWDTHENMITRLQEGYTGADVPVGLVPSLDRAFAALIGDLDDRGLLDETLVLVMGEFGRTPKLNLAGGRDHWPRVFSVVMAGGGVPGGLVIGSSDAMAESPHERPISPGQIVTTVYRRLGIDPASVLYTPDGRPVTVAPHKEGIAEIVG